MLPFMKKNCNEVGLDESGRGPGFGRLYAAAVRWPEEPPQVPELSQIQDSKKIKTDKRMESAYDYVLSTALEWSVAYATEEEVAEHGPLGADMIALHRALDQLTISPGHIVMDGNYFKEYGNIPYTTVVKGDSKYHAIAAASIIAKWTRDQYIRDLCNDFPLLNSRYGILKNKGYLTQQHRSGIMEHGVSEFHRLKYKGCTGQPFNSCKTSLRPCPNSKAKPVIKPKVNIKIRLDLKLKV
jgi:ribonuclease HII